MEQISSEELDEGEGSWETVSPVASETVSTDSADLVSTAGVGARGRNREVLMVRADAPREPTDDAADGVGDRGVSVRSLFIVECSIISQTGPKYLRGTSTWLRKSSRAHTPEVRD